MAVANTKVLRLVDFYGGYPVRHESLRASGVVDLPLNSLPAADPECVVLTMFC